MTISEVIRKMIDFSDGNLHDINHFMKVYAYAKVIGESEHLDRETQDILEVAAVVHDIACPLCREKYGNTNGKYQEQEGAVLAKEFLKDSGFSPAFISRVSYLVGHHHTLEAIEGRTIKFLSRRTISSMPGRVIIRRPISVICWKRFSKPKPAFPC